MEAVVSTKEKARIHFNKWLDRRRTQYREETVAQFIRLFEDALQRPFYYT